MAGIPVAIGAALIATAGTVAATVLSKPKVPKAPLQAPAAQARSTSVVSDAILARRGTRDNQRSGLGGAEATTGVKTRLGA